MNLLGYLGKDRQWYYYGTESPYAQLLSDYWVLEYNNIFAKKKYPNGS